MNYKNLKLLKGLLLKEDTTDEEKIFLMNTTCEDVVSVFNEMLPSEYKELECKSIYEALCIASSIPTVIRVADGYDECTLTDKYVQLITGMIDYLSRYVVTDKDAIDCEEIKGYKFYVGQGLVVTTYKGQPCASIEINKLKEDDKLLFNTMSFIKIIEALSEEEVCFITQKILEEIQD